MYVRIQTGPTPCGELAAAFAPGTRHSQVIGGSGPAFAERYALRGPAGDCVVTVRPGGPDPVDADRAGADLLYEVVADGAPERVTGGAGVAAVLWFDGPIHPVRLALLRRAFTERILRAVPTAPGLVRCLVGWHAGTRSLVEVMLATSVEAIDAAGATVNAPFDGAPFEAEPCGPDRLEPFVVVAQSR
ncbi:hypothetical protein [Pseudonocardia sp. GCM10023141]|uniref:hypothetical protein n=1 Tax=Pseudonocardia sp. GCM10023141 TaxID=3252653 RepID=UPI003622E0B8